MEHEIKFDEDTRKLIKAFRAKVCNGQTASRETLLAYSFLRNRPYVALEKKINEDHESFGIGRITFLDNLAYNVDKEINNIVLTDKDDELIASSGLRNNINDWIMKKYEPQTAIAEEKAA
jgi:hypothetical protein